MLAVQKQTDVSVHRMARQIENVRRRDESDFTGQIANKGPIQVAQHDAYEKLLASTPVYLDGNFPPLPYQPRQASDALQALVARRLSYRHPTTGRGITEIDLNLPSGSFTVVTGRIGSGKSTLLRVLLGLQPLDSG